MNSLWQASAGALSGLLFAALPAMPQAYTISAKPGVVNYIEGSTELNGQAVTSFKPGKLFLAQGDTLSAGQGKAEVLLTPGAFVRIGANSSVRMVLPSLTQTKVEITSGNAFVEISELGKENDIEVIDGGTTTRILKPGLYKFQAGEKPTVAVVDGKLAVETGDRKVDLGRGKELALNSDVKPSKLDSKELKSDDTLYAWSKVRDQYVAAASFSSARTLSNSFTGAGIDPALATPGWFWNSAFNSYAWLPGNGGAYFSPFGYGYFAPSAVMYAPVMYTGVPGRTGSVAVPVNPGNSAATVTNTGQRASVFTATGSRYPSGGGFPQGSRMSGPSANAGGSMPSGSSRMSGPPQGRSSAPTAGSAGGHASPGRR